MEITNAHNVVIYSFKSEGEWRDLSNNGGTVRDVMLGGTWYLGDSVPACLILHCTWPSVQWLPQKLSTWYLGDSVPACRSSALRVAISTVVATKDKLRETWYLLKISRTFFCKLSNFLRYRIDPF